MHTESRDPLILTSCLRAGGWFLALEMITPGNHLHVLCANSCSVREVHVLCMRRSCLCALYAQDTDRKIASWCDDMIMLLMMLWWSY